MAFRIDPTSGRSHEMLGLAQSVVERSETLQARGKTPLYRAPGIVINHHLQYGERFYIRGVGFSVRSEGQWKPVTWERGFPLENINVDRWKLSISLNDVRQIAFKFVINDDPTRYEQGENHNYRDMVLMDIDRYPNNKHLELLQGGISILNQDLANR